MHCNSVEKIFNSVMKVSNACIWGSKCRLADGPSRTTYACRHCSEHYHHLCASVNNSSNEASNWCGKCASDSISPVIPRRGHTQKRSSAYVESGSVTDRHPTPPSLSARHSSSRSPSPMSSHTPPVDRSVSAAEVASGFRPQKRKQTTSSTTHEHSLSSPQQQVSIVPLRHTIVSESVVYYNS